MSPEPVDENSRGGIETRGGNRPADYIPNMDAEGTYLYADDDDVVATEDPELVMRDVSDLFDSEEFEKSSGRVKHATGTHHKQRSLPDSDFLGPIDTEGGTELPVELDIRPDHGREE